ncbi:MAG: hemerythrin domain-containing protein, partial [bacterium]
MKATDMLMHEHRIIERMLNVLSNFSISLENKKRVSPESLKMCVDFIKTFADTCHHHKEEGVLFAKMQEHGMPVNPKNAIGKFAHSFNPAIHLRYKDFL